MGCLPSSEKCEWIELKGFVENYNRENGTSFAHKCCLDRVHRDHPQPEVLCLDALRGDRMVIESKHLIWPPGSAEAHKAWHRLADAISGELTGKLGASPFTLRFSAPDSYKDSDITALAREIASAAERAAHVLQPGECRYLNTSMPVTIEREYPNSRDEETPPDALCFSDIDHGSDGLIDHSRYLLEDNAIIPADFVTMLSNIYEACESKFADYADCRRVLELRTVSGSMASDLGSYWWQQFFAEHPPSPSIDEIWFTFNYGDGDNGWIRKRIYPR